MIDTLRINKLEKKVFSTIFLLASDNLLTKSDRLIDI
jgi:hypothetical protein